MFASNRHPGYLRIAWRKARIATLERVGPIASTPLGVRLVRRAALRALGSAPHKAHFCIPLQFAEAAFGKFDPCWIETASITSILADWVECDGTLLNTLDYFLGSGDWSPLVRSTNGDPVREEARQLQASGLVYSRTESYEALVAAAAAGQPQRRQARTLHTRADVDAYFERFARLFRSIETHGLLPGAALDAAGLRFNGDRGLGVAVDADGTLHRLQGGNHRWAIAQVLGVEQVPVEFRLHHVRSALPLDL